MSTKSASMDEPVCQAMCVHVNGIPTRIMKVEGSAATHKDLDILFLIIPGNPGIIDFYEVFMVTLYKASAGRASVWGVSHAGHASVAKELSHNLDTYSLDEQIDHKVAFIRDFVPPGKRIVLIGHSIGCYIILHILKRQPSLPILKALLLFPTIERMSSSPNGTVLAPLLCYARWLAVIAAYLSSYLSDWVKWYILKWFFSSKKVPECTFHAALDLFNPDQLTNVLYLGALEMREVVEPDLETIQQHLPKLIFYYGALDGWCPIDYYNDMKELFPDGDIWLCKRRIAHAFCLESSELMANLVWNWVRPCIDSLVGQD